MFLWKDNDKILCKVRGEVTNAYGSVMGNRNKKYKQYDQQVHIKICKFIVL